MSLLEFRVALCEGLELHCQAGHDAKLAVRMNEEERSRLRAVGGPENWKCMHAYLNAIRLYLFEGLPLKPDGHMGLARGAHGRLRLSLSYRGQMIVNREYPEKIFHAALRVIGHATALDAVCAGLVDRQHLNLRDSLRALAEGNPAVEATEDDQRAAWEAVWTECGTYVPTPPPPEEPPVDMESLMSDTAAARETPPPAAAPEPPPPPSPAAPSLTKAVTLRGPLKATQVRLFAKSFVETGRLPESLSEAARQQVQAYVEA